MVYRIPLINHPNQLCEACLFGKHAMDVFRKRLHQEQILHFNLYTLMCVVQSIHLFLVKVNTSCSLLMI